MAMYLNRIWIQNGGVFVFESYFNFKKWWCIFIWKVVLVLKFELKYRKAMYLYLIWLSCIWSQKVYLDPALVRCTVGHCYHCCRVRGEYHWPVVTTSDRCIGREFMDCYSWRFEGHQLESNSQDSETDHTPYGENRDNCQLNDVLY